MQKQQSPLAVDLNLHQLIILTQQLLKDLIQSSPSSQPQPQPCSPPSPGSLCPSSPSATQPPWVSPFHSSQVPSISLQSYLRRLYKYTKYSPQCLIICLIYMDRYNMAQGNFVLSWYNVHRLLLTCLMLAVKMQDDVYFDNLTFQKAGGVPANQLFKFQLEVWSKIGFRGFVSAQEYETLLEKIYSVYGEDPDEGEDTGVE